MAVIKDQTSTLEMAWGLSYENVINTQMHCWWDGAENGFRKRSYLGPQNVSESDNLTKCELVCLQGPHAFKGPPK